MGVGSDAAICLIHNTNRKNVRRFRASFPQDAMNQE